ncbi:alpha/beta fold hydrolase [Actinomycetospora sp. TBRC 11914]|uniref:alpha/beta fold hydrolase n=1 Tax=Actinomycetospora sp. TBRC 11914 TaxID=2729387 RepID=UPI00145D5778|nr:alpha/beta fold hydrolase [Actinomycetospora sp. TBRC 11914]NMO92876.1 alpha/beta fold hydrolase [Actinomycetospora sp. TBRC 11914]
MDTQHLRLGGLDVAYLTTGPDDGPLAVLLHGYPDTAWSWRHLAPVLADRGYRVVAPFLRGYAPTGLAPDGSYQSGALVADAVALRRALGDGRPALLVGHDWGAVAAYGAAVHAPALWSRVVTMAVPPLGFAAVALRRRRVGLVARQLRASWYMLFQQLPGVSEAALPRLVPRLWADWSPGYDASAEVPRVLAALDSPARRTAALRYYRAWLQRWRQLPRYRREERAVLGLPTHPLLYLYGTDDGCVRPEVSALAAELLPPGRVVAIPGAGHFLPLEAPDRVAEVVAAFLDEAAPGSRGRRTPR